MAKSEFVIHNSSNGSLAQYVCGAFVELLFLNHVGFCSVEKCIDTRGPAGSQESREAK